MLLQRLAEYGKDHADALGGDAPPPYYKAQTIRWVLDLNTDGSLASRHLTDLADPSDRATRNGREHVIPSITRTVGISPRIAVETPEYLLGWLEKKSNPDRVGKAHEAFRELNDRWAEIDPQGPATALQHFFTGGHDQQVIRPEGWSRGDLVAVQVAGEFMYATESARRFWAIVAGERKGSGETGICLVCGHPGELLKTIPQQLPRRLVPLATQSTSLVSINKATHGFDLTEQLVHAPICTECGLAAMSALQGLLVDQWSTVRTGQDTRMVWWVTGGVPFDLDVLDDPSPERVQQLFAAPARGRFGGDWDTSMFCALAIGGNVSRVMVREWIEMPLDRIQANLAAWFLDHEVTGIWGGEVRRFGIGRLAWAAGRHTSAGYAKFGASGEDRPQGLLQGLFRAALLDKPLPPKLLAHIVHRVRADGRLDAERAALVRLGLRRRPGLDSSDREAHMATLNPHDHEPAYLAGRLFAVLEDIQISSARSTGGEAPNTTFADRYFARAVTSPAVALVAGRKDAQAWLKRMHNHKPAWAYAARQRLDDLFDRITTAGGAPHGAVLAEQAAFILGYHQQRADLRAGRVKKPTDEPNGEAPTPTDDLPEGVTA